MWSVLLVLIVDSLVIGLMAWSDWKYMGVRAKYAIGGMAAMVVSYLIMLGSQPVLAITLTVLGVIFYFALMISRTLKQFSPLDNVIYFLTFISAPMVALFACMIQQGIMVIIAYFNKEKRLIPMLPIYAFSFVVSIVILISVIGLSSPYL